MTEPANPAELMQEATKSALRTGRMSPARVVRHQLESLSAAGYQLHPPLADGGEEILLDSAWNAFWNGRFRPAEVISSQLEALAAAGYAFELPYAAGRACDDFVWGPNSYEACEECGLSFWRHGEDELAE